MRMNGQKKSQTFIDKKQPFGNNLGRHLFLPGGERSVIGAVLASDSIGDDTSGFDA